MKLKSLFILPLIILAASTGLHAAKMRVAIMDLEARDMSQTDAAKVSELLRNEMINTGKFTVIERAQMGKILDEQGFQQTGCTEVTCAVEMGKLLSARKILVGTVMKLGRSIIITGRIVDVEKGIAEFSGDQRADSQDDLYGAIKTFTRKLSAKISGGNAVSDYDTDQEGYGTSSRGPHISAGFNYIIPLGDLSFIADSAMGGYLAGYYPLTTFFDAAVSVAYYTFATNEWMAESLTMIPVLVGGVYTLSLSRSFFATGGLFAGGNYVTRSEYDGSSESAFENMVKVELGAGYRITSLLYFMLKADASLIFEQDGMPYFATFHGSIGYQL